MKNQNDLGSYRGAGRFYKALKAAGIDPDSIAVWDPFSSNPPASPVGKLAGGPQPTGKSAIVIFDVIPLKYPNHFPTGIKGKIKLFKNKRALKNFDVILTISRHSKKEIQNLLKIPENRIKVVYPPLDSEFLKQGICLSEQDNYCIYVGDANWNKNLPTLARAIKLGNIRCIFVGKVFTSERSDSSINHPWNNSFREFLELSRHDSRFIFPGYVSDEKLVNLYKNATCNVLVSIDEGFGYSYIEAGSQKTPSVLSLSPIFKETAGETALFANPHDPQDIADKIQELVDDRKYRDSLGLRSYQRVMEMYSPLTFKKTLLQII